MNKYRTESYILVIFAGIFILVCSMILSGCEQEKEMSATELKQEWIESGMQSAVSWWYLGQQDNYHYILKKQPLESKLYKIRVNTLKINLEERLSFTQDQSKWINLKDGHLEFID